MYLQNRYLVWFWVFRIRVKRKLILFVVAADASRPEHFNLDPKIQIGTDLKIPNSDPDRKFISTFWV